MREAKDCDNCIYDIGSCRSKHQLDKRQVRKLNRTASNDGVWERYYCKKHRFEKGGTYGNRRFTVRRYV